MAFALHPIIVTGDNGFFIRGKIATGEIFSAAW